MCCINKRINQKYGNLPAKEPERRPWFEIVVDSIEFYGKQLIRAMSIIETRIRLLELQPIVDSTSAEASKKIVQCWFGTYPHLRRCIFDQGSKFKKEFRELLHMVSQRVASQQRTHKPIH